MSNPRFTLQDRINSIMESSVVQRGYANKVTALPGRAESGESESRFSLTGHRSVYQMFSEVS